MTQRACGGSVRRGLAGGWDAVDGGREGPLYCTNSNLENAHTINFYIQFSGLENGQRKKATKR